ncbi:MAG: hypothetical protein ABI690_36325 [Chloroflexota bacterium]
MNTSIDAQEQAIRTQITRYRGVRSINLMKAFTMILIGVLMLYMAVSGSLIPPGGLPEKAALGRAIGEQGVTAIGVLIGVVALLGGGIWAYRLIRDLRVGIKHYETQLRGGASLQQ